MSDQAKRYCDECVHAIIVDAADPRFTRCNLSRDPDGIYSVVSRKCEPEARYCTVARCAGEPCGPDGTLFEART